MLKEESLSAQELWSLPAHEFNAWRRKHDLPRLLDFFREALPHFTEWLDAFSISREDFVAVDHTARLLLGSGPKYITDVTQQKYSIDPERSTQVAELSAEQIAAWRIQHLGSMGNTQIHGSKRFIPYWSWLHKTKGLKYFPLYKDINNGFTDDIHYMSWRGGDLRASRALLFHSHPVLKLGGVSVAAEHLDERNLDFVDLDGLVVTGDAWGRTTSITYASCREVRLRELEKAFLFFERCTLEQLAVTNSQIQDLHFLDCALPGAVFRDSRLRGLS